jgi:hypothetical protein
MRKHYPATDSSLMRYQDGAADLGTTSSLWRHPAADAEFHEQGFVHEQGFKSRGPRPKTKRKGVGRTVCLVVALLMILIPLALWLSSLVASSSASTALAHY